MVKDGFHHWVRFWQHDLSMIEQERSIRVQQAIDLAEQERSLRVREALKYSELRSTGKVYNVTFTSQELGLKIGPNIKGFPMMMAPIQRIGRSGGYVPMVGWGDELIAIDSQWVSTWSCSMVMARLKKMTQRPIRLTFSTKEGSMAMSAAQEIDCLVLSLNGLRRQMVSMETKYEVQLESQRQAQVLWQEQQEDEKEQEQQRRLLKSRQQRQQQENLRQLQERTEVKVMHVRDLFQHSQKNAATTIDADEHPQKEPSFAKPSFSQNDDEYLHLGGEWEEYDDDLGTPVGSPADTRASVLTDDDEYSRNVWKQAEKIRRESMKSRASVLTDDDEYSRNIFRGTQGRGQGAQPTTPMMIPSPAFVTTRSRSTSSGRSEVSITM
jgi:hypothetical protein